MCQEASCQIAKSTDSMDDIDSLVGPSILNGDDRQVPVQGIDLSHLGGTNHDPEALGGKPRVFLNDGTGTFSLVNPAVFPDPPTYYRQVTSTFEDIDGDGIRDVIYRPLSANVNNTKMQFVIHKGLRNLDKRDLK